MKRYALSIFTCIAIFISGCSKDDTSQTPTILRSHEYQIISEGNSGVTGVATFTEDSNHTTSILIELKNTDTETHPAYIRYNTSAEGGPVAISLTVCTCSIGTTVVTKLDDGTPINYDGLLVLDGHISIHDSSINLNSIVASANIGANGI